LVAKTAACSLVFCLASSLPARDSAVAPAVSPDWRRTAARVVCSGKVGLKTDGLAQGGRGFLKFSRLFEDRAESVVGLGIIGIGANGGSQFAGGIVEFTLLPEGDTKGVRRIGLRGIEGLGFAKFGDGFPW
jgi:hypothetical protein